MNPVDPSETQLSFLSEAACSRPTLVPSARMALNVLQRLLEDNPAVTSYSAVMFKAVFPSVVAATAETCGLPVTKTLLRPRLLEPQACITQRPPRRADEMAQMESLLEFVQQRLGLPEERARYEQQVDLLLGARHPELLVTPEGMPSQLLASDREDAKLLFRPLLGEKGPEVIEALVEGYVLMRANNADVQTGIAHLFWRHSAGSANAEHFIEGCADGQARAYFRKLGALPEEEREKVLSLINVQTFYAILGN